MSENIILRIVLTLMSLFLILMGLIPLIQLRKALKKNDWKRVIKICLPYARFTMFKSDARIEEVIIKNRFYKIVPVAWVAMIIYGVWTLLFYNLTI
jgi:hypothetical protein